MKLTRTPLASAITLVLMGSLAYSGPTRAADMAAAANDAQDAPATTSDEAKKKEDEAKKLGTVTVKGIRASLEHSIDTKRESTNHVEVVTAEDIGKMPDKNIADSLMRVPGVTTSSAGANEGGFDEKDRVSMRGTNPSLTQTLINGHTVSSGDWFVLNQSGTVGRSVSYTLLPSELVGSVVVHKTAEASQLEGGVVGSVDVITRKPLDFAKPFTGQASIGTVYADQPGKFDPQFNALMNWKNADDTFGVLVQAFYEQRHLRRDGVEVLGYDTFKAGNPIVTAHPDLLGVYYPILIGAALFEQERKRTGGYIELQWRPNDRFNADLSYFTSKMDAPNYNRNYMLWGSRIVGDGRLPSSYTVENNTLVAANWVGDGNPSHPYGVYDQISRPDASADSDFLALDLDWQVADAFRLKGNFGKTRGHGKTPTQDVAEWDIARGLGAGYQFNGIDDAPDFNLGTEITNTPVNASLDWIFGTQNMNVKDEETWGQIDGQFDLDGDLLTHIKFGARWSEHKRSLHDVIAQGPFASAFNPANWPSGYENYPGDFGNGLGGNFPSDVWYYTPDQLAAFNAANTNRDPTLRHYYFAEYDLDEKNSSVYVQADWEHGKWSGNFGVRFVHTDEHIINNLDASPTTPGAITGSLFGAYIPTAFDNDYDDVLPSVNFRYDVRDDVVLRFAANKTMTRPDYSALAGNFSLSPPAVLTGIGGGSASNPDLKPVRSNNFDLSLEWYYAPEALLSVSAFYMDLESYIVPARITKVYQTFQPPAPPSGAPVTYILSSYDNSSGEVQGIEVSWQQPIWGHFGIQANYTYADGEETGGGPLVGTSRNTWNLGGYYETDKWHARLDYNYRSEFFSGLDRATAFSQAGVGNLSGSVGYRFNDMFSVTFDALNLNNPTLRYFALNKDQPRSIYQSGRQYYLNLRVDF